MYNECKYFITNMLTNVLPKKYEKITKKFWVENFHRFMQPFLCSRTFYKKHVCDWVSLREVFSNFFLRFQKMDILENVHFAWPGYFLFLTYFFDSI